MGIREQIRSNVAYTVVLVLVVASVAYLIIEPGHWRRGTAVLSLALFLAGVARAVLPTSRAGALAIRARWFDTIAYWLFCAVMVAVTIRLHE